MPSSTEPSARRRAALGLLVLFAAIGVVLYFTTCQTRKPPQAAPEDGAQSKKRSLIPRRESSHRAEAGAPSENAPLEAEAGGEARAQAQPEDAPPATDTPRAGFANSLGMNFVPVPGTNVLFCVHETRAMDYAAFMADPNRGYDMVGGDANFWRTAEFNGKPVGRAPNEQVEQSRHPVCFVSWDDAAAFCQWLSRREGRSYRLPTDREWSMAVGLNQEPPAAPKELDGRSYGYPWDEALAQVMGNYGDASSGLPMMLRVYNDGHPTTAPVMSFRPNAHQLHDMGGNVWEWCADWYDTQRTARVLRGGSWGTTFPQHFLSSFRFVSHQSGRFDGYGFRVVAIPSQK